MKKNLLLAISLFFIAISASAQRTTITKFEGRSITGLVANGAFDLRLSQGKTCSAKVEIAAEAADKLTFEITDQGYVRLGYGTEFTKFFTLSKNRPVAYIVVENLNYLNISGTCNAIGTGTFTSSQPLTMTVAGSAFCDFIKVSAKQSFISVGGTAKVENFDIKDTGKLTVEVNGSSILNLSGTALSARLSTSGTAQLNALNFAAPEINANASGSSLMKANVPQTADVTTSGLASFKYIGNGVITGPGTAKPL